MISVAFKTFCQFTTVAALSVVGSASLTAGEPIQFSREKGRPSPGPEEKSRVPKENLDRFTRISPGAPSDFILPIQPEMRSRDPKEDRRRKNAELEKKNWMIYDRGELQEKDDEEGAFGIQDYSLEKDDGVEGGLFARKDDDSRSAARPRLSSSLSKLPGQNRNSHPSAKPVEENTKETKEDKHAGAGEKQNGAPAADQSSKEIDLRSLLAPVKTSSLALSDSSDAPSKDPGASAFSSRSRDDQSHRDDVKANIFGSAPASYKSPGLGDAPGLRSDLRATPASPSLSAPTAPASSGLNNSLDRNLRAAGFDPQRPGFDANPGRSFNNPYSPTPSPLNNDPYFPDKNRSAYPGFGPASPLQQQPTPPSSQPTWDRFGIPRR